MKRKRKPISEFEAQRIAQLLMQHHAAHLAEDEWFEVEGYRTPDEVYTKMTLRNEDDSMVYPIECRIDLEYNGIKSQLQGQDLLLDFQDYYFGRYFEEDRDLYVTIDWGNIQFDDYTLQVRGQIRNLKVERLTSRFLAGDLSAEEVEQQAKSKSSSS